MRLYPLPDPAQGDRAVQRAAEQLGVSQPRFKLFPRFPLTTRNFLGRKQRSNWDVGTLRPRQKQKSLEKMCGTLYVAHIYLRALFKTNNYTKNNLKNCRHISLRAPGKTNYTVTKQRSRNSAYLKVVKSKGRRKNKGKCFLKMCPGRREKRSSPLRARPKVNWGVVGKGRGRAAPD